MLSGLFRVTENTFAHRRQWRNLHLLLERADLPLRTVEFTWLLIGCSFVGTPPWNVLLHPWVSVEPIVTLAGAGAFANRLSISPEASR